MRINPDLIIVDYDGKPIEIPSGKDSTEKLTLRSVIIQALNRMDQGKPLAAEQKNMAFQICMRMQPGKPLGLKVDDMAFIKERVAIFYNALVYGRVGEVFDGPGEVVDEQGEKA